MRAFLQQISRFLPRRDALFETSRCTSMAILAERDSLVVEHNAAHLQVRRCGRCQLKLRGVGEDALYSPKHELKDSWHRRRREEEAAG